MMNSQVQTIELSKTRELNWNNKLEKKLFHIKTFYLKNLNKIDFKYNILYNLSKYVFLY